MPAFGPPWILEWTRLITTPVSLVFTWTVPVTQLIHLLAIWVDFNTSQVAGNRQFAITVNKPDGDIIVIAADGVTVGPLSRNVRVFLNGGFPLYPQGIIFTTTPLLDVVIPGGWVIGFVIIDAQDGDEITRIDLLYEYLQYA